MLSFDDHINNVCKAAHFHIRAVRHIRRCLSVDDAKTLLSAMMSSRLDYCHSLILLERIRVKTETEIADEQAGFRQGRWTRDQITSLRILMHKAREHQQPLYMCFMDFKKALS